MTELREFARRSGDLEKLGVRLIPIGVDDQQHARDVWEKVAEKKFTILSDSWRESNSSMAWDTRPDIPTTIWPY